MMKVTKNGLEFQTTTGKRIFLGIIAIITFLVVFVGGSMMLMGEFDNIGKYDRHQVEQFDNTAENFPEFANFEK